MSIKLVTIACANADILGGDKEGGQSLNDKCSVYDACRKKTKVGRYQL